MLFFNTAVISASTTILGSMFQAMDNFYVENLPCSAHISEPNFPSPVLVLVLLLNLFAPFIWFHNVMDVSIHHSQLGLHRSVSSEIKGIICPTSFSIYPKSTNIAISCHCTGLLIHFYKTKTWPKADVTLANLRPISGWFDLSQSKPNLESLIWQIWTQPKANKTSANLYQTQSTTSANLYQTQVSLTSANLHQTQATTSANVNQSKLNRSQFASNWGQPEPNQYEPNPSSVKCQSLQIQP